MIYLFFNMIFIIVLCCNQLVVTTIVILHYYINLMYMHYPTRSTPSYHQLPVATTSKQSHGMITALNISIDWWRRQQSSIQPPRLSLCLRWVIILLMIC